MIKKKLGTSQLEVSEVCLGTMTFGEQNSEDEAFEQMDYAFENGVNFFDTAELYSTVPIRAETYGKTERIIGNWFKSRQNRKDIVLASKVTGPGPQWIRDGKGYDNQNIEQAIDASLARLQTDYIDLYQLHWPQRGSYHFQQNWHYNPQFEKAKVTDAMLKVLVKLNELKQKGKIRYYGVSNETCWGAMMWLHLAQSHQLLSLTSVQNEYSLLCRHFDTDWSEVSMAEKIPLLAYTPLAGGALTGKYLNKTFSNKSRWSLMKKHNQPNARDTHKTQKAILAYQKIAEKFNMNLTQLALQFVLSRPFLASVIVGATTASQLKENIQACRNRLSEEALSEIDQAHQNHPMPF